MRVGRRALAWCLLTLPSACAANAEEQPCGAVAEQLELVRRAEVSLHRLTAELGTTLFSACSALAQTADASRSTPPPDVDTLVAVCGLAARALAALKESGTEVAGVAAECREPSPDEPCARQYSNEASAALCASVASFAVECSGADVSVSGDDRVAYEACLSDVLRTYAASRIASDASSSYVDVALPLLTEHESCVGPLDAEHWDDVTMLQAILVMSSDLAEQVDGFPLDQ